MVTLDPTTATRSRGSIFAVAQVAARICHRRLQCGRRSNVSKAN
jgi:hypothetical protein